MAKHKLGLGHGPFYRINQQQAAVRHVDDTFYLPTEIGMPRSINEIDINAPVHYGRILSHDGNPLFPLKGITVHYQLAYCLVISKDLALLEHGIYQGGLAMVNVGNNRDISDITAIVHVWCNPAFIYLSLYGIKSLLFVALSQPPLLCFFAR
jgi:hypothetical protein